MKTKIDVKKTPFGIQPKGLVYQYVLNSVNQRSDLSLLDFGCRNGDFLSEIDKIDAFGFTYGVDLDRTAIESARLRGTKAHFEHIMKNHKFEDVHEGRFDVITVIGVIEHIYDQSAVLEELSRLLKPNGLMIVAVPGIHLFSFLDMGNWKFKFPRIHKFFVRLTISESDYQYRYVSNEFGCIGDIESEKAYHEHFSKNSLQKLISRIGRFEIVDMDGLGFFHRILANAQFFLPNRFKCLMSPLIEWDFKLGNVSELVFVLKKIG